jgi:predicted nucleic acid-binding protein
VIEQAQKGGVEIWTSTFTMAEVWKRKCDSANVGLEAPDDTAFEDYVEQAFVTRVAVDFEVGTAARRLLRKYPEIGKPQDAIHLATALLENVDELHTFDNADLLGLDGKLLRQDGEKLKICPPPSPPDPNEGTLFEGLDADDGEQDNQAVG